ncbi:hypothetical protein L1887_08140 [Cichorium endivia]|nr:hypothetical protein L1887_08140 [Cichorium endivia]
MAISSKLSTRSQVKSISLPCRSHPTTIRIEQQLNAAKLDAAAATLPSAQTVCIGLSQLTELYKTMDDLLNSSTTRVSISRQQNKKWVEDLVEESVKFLDVCGSTRDMVAQIKEHITDVHCALRRRRTSENNVDCSSIRRKMKKDVKRLVASLKEIDNTIGGGSIVVDSDQHQLAAVMKAVVGVSEMTVAVFESLLLFFAMPVSKPNRWSLVVSKLIHKGMVACDDQQELGILNEMESIDAGLQALCKDGSSEKIQTAKCRLERVETQLECIESRLESLFRRLIGTRTSLLNIMSS